MAGEIPVLKLSNVRGRQGRGARQARRKRQWFWCYFSRRVTLIPNAVNLDFKQAARPAARRPRFKATLFT